MDVKKAALWFLDRCQDNPVDYLAKYRQEAPQVEQPSATAQTSPSVIKWPIQSAESQTNVEPDVVDAPVCPRCGAPMVLRKAKRGAHKGEQFYGCSNYPHCRGVISLKSE